jgi:hypothetical protein
VKARPVFLVAFEPELAAALNDPDLSERAILELVAMHMVESLEAIYASVRIHDPGTEQMLSFGSYPLGEDSRESRISPEGSIVERYSNQASRLLSLILRRNLSTLTRQLSKGRRPILLWQFLLRYPDFSPMNETPWA